MTFSFLIPSRGKLNDIIKTLNSFELTTNDKKNLEVLFLFDEGTDETLPDIIKSMEYSFKIKCYYRPHSEWWSRDYFNFLANRCSGENICAFNDDAWMKTVGWDDKIRKHIKNSGWSIYFIDIPDTARIKKNHNFPCFPMVSRKGVATIGYFFHEQIKVYPLDKVMNDMYVHVDRVIKVDDVLIQHDHIEETDPSKSRLLQIFIEQRDKGELNVDISREVLMLLKEAQKDYKKKPTKIQKILKIIKER